jgi:hypothetical protein
VQRVCIKVFLEFFRTGDDDAGLPPIKAIVCDTGAVNIFFFFFFTLMSASCVYARFYSFSSSRNYFFLFVVFVVVVVVRDYYTGESDEKAKTQQKNSPKTKKFLLF